MGNPKHLEILNQGLREWNRWREKNPRITPDWKKLDNFSIGSNFREDNPIYQMLIISADLYQCVR